MSSSSGVVGEARDAEAGQVDGRERRDRPDREQHRRGDDQRAADPDAQDRPGVGVPALERSAGIAHALNQDQIVDAHPHCIGSGVSASSGAGAVERGYDPQTGQGDEPARL